jgi:hypothetical protein
MIRLYCQWATLEAEIERWLNFVNDKDIPIFREQGTVPWEKGWGAGIVVFIIYRDDVGYILANKFADRLGSRCYPAFDRNGEEYSYAA